MSNLPVKAESRAVRLHREPEGKKLAGVCTGLAEWSGVPTLIWRLGFILSTLLWGAGLPIYVILWMAMDKPPKPVVPEPTPDDLSPEDKEIWDAVKDEMESLELRND